MKQFAVAKYTPNMGLMMYFSSQETGRNHTAEKFEQYGTDHNEDFEQTQDLYYTDNEGDAEALALYLLNRYPQFTWVVLRTTLVVSRPPGDVTRARYTDKGLLPV